jgi:hypothetical protein
MVLLSRTTPPHPQALPSPSPDAYARLWVNDHLLYPNNTTLAGWGKGIGPKWIPLPPRALDGNGKTVEVPASVPLGSAYEFRFEYICLASSGCGCAGSGVSKATAHGTTQPPTATVRWVSYSLNGDGGQAPLRTIPRSALVATQSDPEIARRNLRKTLEAGWGTFDHTSSISWVLLPESFKVGVAFYQKSTGALFGPSGLSVFTLGTTVANPTIAYSGGFTLRLGLHSVDQTYTEAWIAFNNANFSIATTVDSHDTSRLTMVVTSAALPSSDATNTDSDFVLLLIPSFGNGRAGTVSASNDGKSISGIGAGLRTSTLHALQGSMFQLPATPVNSSVPLPSVYMGLALSATPTVIGTCDPTTVTAAAVIKQTAEYRANEAASLTKYVNKATPLASWQHVLGVLLGG